MEFDLDKVLEAAKDPQAAKTIDSVSGLLKDADGVLKLFEKSLSLLERTGALPGIVRGMGKKLGVDVDTPLKTKVSDPLTPQSENHKIVMMNINSLSNEQLIKLVEGLKELERKQDSA